ncbi:DEAD/DEAH box helicase [Amycolatopsis sp. NPDC051061]|uniref:DEAD/DEAH box helicase n=1 Tax=Amycolatopsis sp. NPDC051061 TaxID=3155042 RepID=UPI00342F8068
MAFKGGAVTSPPPASPEALYSELIHTPLGIPGLWGHQVDILREYEGKHVNTPDLALELPTGTGKTVTGLLIADWVRRYRQVRTAYACPTRQLARYVSHTAGKEGIPVALLIGSHHDWPLEAQMSYTGAEAVAVTTYSTVFNSNPKLPLADLLLFDDAHAGEQYVGEQYAVTVKRSKDEATYFALLDAVASALDGMLLQRLRDPSPDPGAHHQVRVAVPLGQPGMVEAVDAALTTLVGSQAFRHSMIRHALKSCLVYVTYSGILIRPVAPPTDRNPLFSNARQRLYLSATLGNGGELERSFGRSAIARLALPAATPSPRSGRRYFVFPELVGKADPVALTRAIVQMAGKALVLAPDGDTAESRATELATAGWPVMTIDHVEEGMDPFVQVAHATCGLANRYDGLDLPNDACRAVVLEGVPDHDSLQERFLSERVRAGTALAERIRTRVVQGAGRCTRGPNDWALVVVLGTDLTKYLMLPETRRALAPELQAEISFGLVNSRETTEADFLENVRVFLEQGDAWRNNAEPLLAEQRKSAVRKLPDGTDALSKAVDAEIEACESAAQERWADAARRGQDAARDLGGGGDATRGYRAFWLYLAGVWMDQAADDSGDAATRRTSRALITQAEAAAKPGTWTRELASLPDAPREALPPEDAVAVRVIATKLAGGVAKGRHDKAVEQMVTGLAQRKAGAYEPALTQLGGLIGAESYKPDGKGRSDSVWCWGNTLWIAVEAKSDHEPTGEIAHKEIRQANDQLRVLASDRGEPAPPAGSVTVMVSPKPAVNETGIAGAERHVHVVEPHVVTDLAHAARAGWEDLLAIRAGNTADELRAIVATTMLRHGLLPTQIRERLTVAPVFNLLIHR